MGIFTIKKSVAGGLAAQAGWLRGGRRRLSGDRAGARAGGCGPQPRRDPGRRVLPRGFDGAGRGRQSDGGAPRGPAPAGRGANRGAGVRTGDRGVQIYLPIADVGVNALLLIGIGAFVGVMSGLFGVGGGFLLTPLLFFIGIPPPIAVATGANQVVASSFSGVLAHLQRKTVDFRMGWVLLAGGLVGSSIGVGIFAALTRIGQVDLVVQLCYVGLLGVIGAMMFQESLRALRASQGPQVPRRRQHGWVYRLPFKVKFRASGLYISAIPPFLVGVLVGIMGAIMGVGGGFIMVPAMIYILGMPTKVVIGTSLFQITFVAAYTTVMHAVNSNTVDIMLAVLLIVGGVIGAQVGTRMGARLRAEQLRFLLALMVLAVAARLAVDLVVQPEDLFSLGVRQ